MTRPQPRCRSCSSVSVLDHTTWAAVVVAGPIARDAGLSGPDREDVIAAAQLRIVELLARRPGDNPAPFDPTEGMRNNDVIGAFRGWAYLSVKDAAASEANRIRSGGTIRRKVRPENLEKAKCFLLGDADHELSGGGGGASVTRPPIAPSEPKTRPEAASEPLPVPPNGFPPPPDPSKITTALERYAAILRCQGNPMPTARALPRVRKKAEKFRPKDPNDLPDVGEPDPEVTVRFQDVFSRLTGGDG